ncbi:MAG: aminotransferase class IV [Flammeovirgaceae bacterium]|nr:aminotransferase class IV [Flammeovirgaceae bacterium]
MSQFIESIRLFNGKFENMGYHEKRMRASLQFINGMSDDFNLEKFLSRFSIPVNGLYKCRIVYDQVNMEVEFIPYKAVMVKKIKLVRADFISYDLKFKNRKEIEELFEQRDGCDDVLIIKNGIVTDCSYSNIVFKKGARWMTPATPLLKGTMRQSLLDSGKIFEELIKTEDMRTYQSCKLINAMLGFDGPEIEVNNIVS